MTSISRAELKQLIFDLFEEDDEFAHTLFVISHNRKKLIELIWSLQPHINEHLMKLLMYSNHESSVHWIKEIRTCLDRIGRMLLKPKNSKPKQHLYYKYFYLGPFEGSEQVIIEYYYIIARENFEDHPNYDGHTMPIFEEETIPFERINGKFANFYQEISELFAQKHYQRKLIEPLIRKYFIDE